MKSDDRPICMISIAHDWYGTGLTYSLFALTRAKIIFTAPKKRPMHCIFNYSHLLSCRSLTLSLPPFLHLPCFAHTPPLLLFLLFPISPESCKSNQIICFQSLSQTLSLTLLNTWNRFRYGIEPDISSASIPLQCLRVPSRRQRAQGPQDP